MTIEFDQFLAEQLAQEMQRLLEEHGWSSSFGRDPILILIEYEDNLENED